MCLALPARILSVAGEEAEVELYGGTRVTVNLILRPDASAGQYVLVDRGLVLEVISDAEAESILAMYEEIGQMLEVADAEWPTDESEGEQHAATASGGANA